MDKCEVEKLFTLFSQFWPNKQVTTKMKLAWEIALEPYSYADVRAAAVAYARRNKFFPMWQISRWALSRRRSRRRKNRRRTRWSVLHGCGTTSTRSASWAASPAMHGNTG